MWSSSIVSTLKLLDIHSLTFSSANDTGCGHCHAGNAQAWGRSRRRLRRFLVPGPDPADRIVQSMSSRTRTSEP